MWLLYAEEAASREGTRAEKPGPEAQGGRAPLNQEGLIRRRQNSTGCPNLCQALKPRDRIFKRMGKQGVQHVADLGPGTGKRCRPSCRRGHARAV